MNNLAVGMLMLTFSLGSGCHSSQSGINASAEAGSKPVKEWRVSLDSSGGFTGRGAGNVSAASDGSVTASTAAPNGSEKSSSLTEAEKKRLAAAIASSLDASWKSPDIPRYGADMIIYSIKLEADGAQRTVSWREDTRGSLSAEVSALAEALIAVRDRVRSGAGSS